MGRMLKFLRKNTGGSQIAEFAIGLPFLMVVLVGVFDFGQAFNTKQHLSTAARDAARFASNQTTLDWSSGASAASIAATRDLVDSYLISAGLNDCGLPGAVPVFDVSTMTWTYRTQGTCPQQLQLVVQRANSFLLSDGTHVISTKVTLTYPFQWHFSSVIKVLLPNSNYPGPIFTITTSAVMANLT